MSELVKINLVKELEKMGIFNVDINEIIKSNYTDDNSYMVFNIDDICIFTLTKESYEELDKF